MHYISKCFSFSEVFSNTNVSIFGDKSFYFPFVLAWTKGESTTILMHFHFFTTCSLDVSVDRDVDVFIGLTFLKLITVCLII